MHGVLCTNVPWPIHVIQRLPLSSGGRTSTSTGSNVDKPPSNYGRWVETVVIKASFSLVCVSPRNHGWRLNSQLSGTLLAIHGRQQCPISGKRETMCQMEGTTHYYAGRLAAECKGSPPTSRWILAQNWLRKIERPFGLLSFDD